MTWNYRIIKSNWKLKKLKGEQFAIHEVYYDKNGNPTSWSEKPQYLCAETVEAIMDDLILIRNAFKQPILELKRKKLQKV